MNKTKKIISIVLALVLVASIGTIMLVSNAGDNDPTTSVTVTVDKNELQAGESATVTVKATTNYAVGTMSIPVFYDKTLVTVSDGTVTLAEYETKNVTTDLTAVDTSKIYDNTNIDNEKFGFVLASYIAGANSTVQTMLEDDVVLTFKITAKADVSGTATVKVITESVKTTNNIAGMLYFGKQPDGNTIDAIPENIEGINVNNASASVKIGGGKPGLLLSELGEEMGAVVIKTEDIFEGFQGVIFGIDAHNGEMIADYVATEAGSIEVVANDAGSDVGTGAIVNLLDDEGNVLESYVFVLFGDVDGNGYIDSVDSGTIAEAEAGLAEFEYYYYELAGDYDGNGYYDSVDAGYVAEYEAGLYDITQAEIATEVVNNYSF